MKKLAAVIIPTTIIVSACLAPSFTGVYPVSSFMPSISQQGQKTFVFSVSNQLPRHFGENPDIENIHSTMLSQELGQRGYCLNGYTIDKKITDAYGTAYQGTCK